MSCPKCGCKTTYQCDSGFDGEAADENLERCAACGHVFDIEDGEDEGEDLAIDDRTDHGEGTSRNG